MLNILKMQTYTTTFTKLLLNTRSQMIEINSKAPKPSFFP